MSGINTCLATCLNSVRITRTPRTLGGNTGYGRMRMRSRGKGGIGGSVVGNTHLSLCPTGFGVLQYDQKVGEPMRRVLARFRTRGGISNTAGAFRSTVGLGSASASFRAVVVGRRCGHVEGGDRRWQYGQYGGYNAELRKHSSRSTPSLFGPSHTDGSILYLPQRTEAATDQSGMTRTDTESCFNDRSGIVSFSLLQDISRDPPLVVCLIELLNSCTVTRGVHCDEGKDPVGQAMGG